MTEKQVNQQILKLDTRLSRLIDSLCFQLAVSLPDQNSLSLLEIIQMRKNQEITYEQLYELYTSWLQAKNVLNPFNTKQVDIYPKNELITNNLMAGHLGISQVYTSLNLLQTLYNSSYGSTSEQLPTKLLKQVDELFEYLDIDGYKHLRLSHLFFLAVAVCINQKIQIPSNYQSFKQIFQDINNQLCAVKGMVCKRWFRNYFLFGKDDQSFARNVLAILKEMEKQLRVNAKRIQRQIGLPNIIEDALWRARELAVGMDHNQIYRKIFQQNQQVMFFNGGSQQTSLNQNYFTKRYQTGFIESIQIDNSTLKQLNFLIKFILNDYLELFGRLAQNLNQKKGRSNSSYLLPLNSPIIEYKSQKTANSFHNIQSMNYIAKHKKSDSYAQPASPTFLKLQIKQSAGPKTSRRKDKGNLTTRTDRPSTQLNNDSPFLRRTGQKKKQAILVQSQNGDDFDSLYTRSIAPVFRNAEKKGLQKNSCYEKLSFFRNKRVESFDIVIKRLKQI